ncbi:VOC family protein [Lederbergia citrea]|uniref:VOC family protein n=1 Tax=Lederbergia citrea TaxID=2833581 RepID=A0A942URF5_9BACI|nr:VOC family protein [Lederbergia citrea]MBS4204578.1 VOC family protein [Lederbergia citrea]MBS4223578.1 VOC family protein [Lederbergia citrea]
MQSHSHSIIGQVVLKVQNLESTVAFYKDLLGFQIIEQTDNKAALSADGKTALLILEKRDDATPRQPQTTGLYHIAFLLPNRSDLADIVNHFIQTRTQLQGASDHHVSEALYLADPEGNGIEIYIDRAPEEWKWEGDQVYMTTQALDIESLLGDASDAGWKGMPEDTIIGHIHLQVSELQKTRQFYCEGLGFDPVLNYGSQALFISKDRYHHHIGLNTWNSAGGQAPAENSAGLKWFSIVVRDEDEKRKVVNQLEKINAWMSEENGEIITKDPSGIYIKLTTKENIS